ncbi:pentapeptide repeat-containing protein [Ferruginibacter sp.]|nr:pentapeptide repeat-containing protein [Ferruginibacter sp.]
MAQQMKCRIKGCSNPVISFSDKCGGHTSSKKIIAALKQFKGKKFNKLYLHELDISKVKFQKKLFYNSKFGEISFEDMTFETCLFELLHCFNSTFNSCSFTSCTFSECDFQDVTFSNCTFTDCEFKSSSFIEGAFHDDTVITNTSFIKGLFIGFFIYDTKAFNNIKVIQTKFNQASINRANFKNCSWKKCEFTKTTWYDSAINDSKWIDIVHDFDITGSPKLCDFTNTEFKNTTVPSQMRKWNIFKGSREKFFLKTVDTIEKFKHPNYLPELTICLERLAEAGFKPNFLFSNKIIGIFRRQLQLAGETGDYRTAGDIIGEYGRIPAVYKISGFTLPAPQHEQHSVRSFPSSLSLHFSMDTWTIDNIYRLYSYCYKLTKVLPTSSLQIEVSDILKGSFIQTFWGDIRQLLVAGRLLDLQKLEIEIEDKQLEKELKEIELIKQHELLKTHRKERQLELEKQQLENVKLKLEIENQAHENFERKLRTIELLDEKLGLNYVEYSKSEMGKSAAQIALELKKDFPLLDLRLTIFNSQEPT